MRYATELKSTIYAKRATKLAQQYERLQAGLPNVPLAYE